LVLKIGVWSFTFVSIDLGIPRYDKRIYENNTGSYLFTS
jgi:hypothetical protein